ncbi:hypothetical protein Ddye_008830 [Dipteronia dyeriana]|uniref:Reverse transcriptase zinc-binding domain-containing protein n=1 Tax=Dipteronia dyeriana TaxID=168575 RepID=A0AAD9XB53_9ROSI|nr:hypothetical protein Ddye_008830 [Dipteronia dyeriana]
MKDPVIANMEPLIDPPMVKPYLHNLEGEVSSDSDSECTESDFSHPTTLDITCVQGGVTWADQLEDSGWKEISFIYVSVSYITRRSLWSSFIDIAGSEVSWLDLEDFNSVLEAHETTGNVSTISYDDFSAALTACDLVDIKVKEVFHTRIDRDLIQIITSYWYLVQRVYRWVHDLLGFKSAPGPDGFSDKFYSHRWEIVGHDMVLAVHDFFHSGLVFPVYRWPSSLLKDLNAAIRNFFWIGSIDGRKSVQVARKSCYKPKDGGGLGVKDLGILNKAMLKKFTWRMLTEESFIFTYLRAQFFTQNHKPRTCFGFWGKQIWASFIPSRSVLIWCLFHGKIPMDIALRARGGNGSCIYHSTESSLVGFYHLDFLGGVVLPEPSYLEGGKIVLADALSLFWSSIHEADSLQSGTMKNSVDELQTPQRLHVSGHPPKAPRILEWFFAHAEFR